MSSDRFLSSTNLILCLLALILVALLFTVSCSAETLETVRMTVAGHDITVEIADTQEKRSTGLMNRKSLDEEAGMLFVFETEHQQSFWMKNTLIPLSIAFIAADGTIRQIENMDAGSLASTVSRRNVLYALEVNEGWFEKKGILPGDTVELPSGLN